MSYESDRKLETLEGAAKRYRLRRPDTTNDSIAKDLSTPSIQISSPENRPCVFCGPKGDIVAIRTERDILVIFHFAAESFLSQQAADLGNEV